MNTTKENGMANETVTVPVFREDGGEGSYPVELTPEQAAAALARAVAELRAERVGNDEWRYRDDNKFAPALGVAAEILALFPQRTKAGRPKRASRYGFFVLGDGGDLFYYEPHHGVQEFHGNIIEDKFDEKELLDFFADFED